MGDFLTNMKYAVFCWFGRSFLLYKCRYCCFGGNKSWKCDYLGGKESGNVIIMRRKKQDGEKSASEVVRITLKYDSEATATS